MSVTTTQTSTVYTSSILSTVTDTISTVPTLTVESVRGNSENQSQSSDMVFVISVSVVAGIFLLMLLYFTWYYFYRKNRINPLSDEELGRYLGQKKETISDTGTLAKLVEKNPSSPILAANELSRATSKGSTSSLSRGISKNSGAIPNSLATYTARPENVRKAFTMTPRKNSVEPPPYARATLAHKRSSDFIPRNTLEYPYTKRNSDTVLQTQYGSFTTASFQKLDRYNTIGERRPTKLKTSISFDSTTTSVVNQDATPKKRRSADFTYSPITGVNAVPTVAIPSFDGVMENSKLRNVNKSTTEFSYSPKTGVGQQIPEVPAYQPDLQHLEKLRREAAIEKRNTVSDFQFSPSTGVESLAYKVPEFNMPSLNRKKQ